MDKIFLSEILAFQSTLPCGSDRSQLLPELFLQHFNPRSLAGATKIFEPWHSVIAFQSTLPCGSDLLSSLTFSSTWGFNPRSLAGATSYHDAKNGFCIAFQSTLPRGSDCMPRRFSSPLHHFNPRSLTGATEKLSYTITLQDISIHAPLRERPFAFLGEQAVLNISIHAPLRERPSALKKVSFSLQNFNPRSLTGATRSYRRHNLDYTISIHAPSRERPPFSSFISLPAIFQSTLPRGSD